MATERLSMRKIREILRQKWALACSHRQVAASLQVSIGTVTGVLRRATHAGLDWPQVQQLLDETLEARLYGAASPGGRGRAVPDGAYLHAERKKPGVTLELLHLEYLEQHPDGYRYTRFCDYYRQWLARHRLSMRQEHRAGEKVFVDYAGQKPSIIGPTTGEVLEAELLSASLGRATAPAPKRPPPRVGPSSLCSSGTASRSAWMGGAPGATTLGRASLEECHVRGSVPACL